MLIGCADVPLVLGVYQRIVTAHFQLLLELLPDAPGGKVQVMVLSHLQRIMTFKGGDRGLGLGLGTESILELGLGPSPF